MKSANIPNLSVLKSIPVIFIVIIIIFFSITIVPAGHVGVHDLFGKVKATELQAGFHLKNPFAYINKMSIKTQDYTMSFSADEGAIKGRGDAISALTKEGLTVELDMTVLYKLDPEKADQVYRTIGNNYVDVIVRPQIRSAIREVVASYEAKTIYSEERTTVENQIFDLLKDGLEPRGIIIEQVLLRNVKLPPKLANAIESKLTAEQLIEEKKFQVQSEKEEAERKRAEAEGIADANAIISTSLSDEYLTWYWINNLDTHDSVIYVPVGDDGIPLFREIGEGTNKGVVEE